MKKFVLIGVIAALAACGSDDPSTNKTNNDNNVNNTANNQNNVNNTANNQNNNNENNNNQNNNNQNNNNENNNNGMDMGVEDMSMPEDMNGGDDMAGGDDVGVDMAEVDMAPDMGEPTGDTCDMAIDVTAGVMLTGESTTGLSDDYDSPVTATNCPSGAVTGPDIVYSVSPTAETTYEVTVTPAGNYDPMIYVREDCAQDACIDGTVFNGAGQAETLTFTVPANTTYYIIVDGEFISTGDDAGDFDLDVVIQ